MSLVNRLSLTYPLSLCTFLVLLSVVLSQLGAVALASVWDVADRQTFAVFTRYAVAGLTILLLWKMGVARDSGVSMPYRDWRRNWHLAVLPMIIVGCLNFTGVEWGALTFNLSGVVFWLTENLATGVFEEVMMRAMAFYLLWRAWKDTPNGLLKAAVAQALIFGLLHFINLIQGFTVDVIAQVIYATMLGISFAGIVAYTRSIWPAAVAHGFINAVGNLNDMFVPGFVDTSTPVATYVLLIGIMFVVATVPGLYMLKLARQHDQVVPEADHAIA